MFELDLPWWELVLREADCALDKMKYVFLEANGQITVLREESSST